jgi:hypothetical protein
MYLIEIFLPLADNEGAPFPPEQHEAVERAVADRFGAVSRPTSRAGQRAIKGVSVVP